MEAQDSIQWLLRPADEPQSVDIPQYYREGYFAHDTLLHPELTGGGYGTAGEPVDYSVRGDDVVTSLLLLCFVIAVIAFTGVKAFIARQLKSFFYLPHEGTAEVAETAAEVRFLLSLLFLTAMLLSLLYYFFTLHHIGETFVLPTQYHLIIIYMAIVMAYFFVKIVLHSGVNSVLFDGKRNLQWLRAFLFLTAVEAVLLFPAVVVQAYFDSDVQNVETYFVFVLVFVKLLTIYKCYVIFFRRSVFFLQIILYFCALEIVPLLFLWGALGLTANNLKINF